jgi:hypothetical protein
MQDNRVNAELSKVLSGPVGQPPSVGGISQAMAILMPGSADAAVGPTGGATGSPAQGALPDVISQNTTQLTQLQSTLQGQLDSLIANTQAVIDNTSKSASSTAASAATNFATSILGGGLIGSIVTGLTGLFGGDSSSAPAPLVKFALPPKQSYEGGVQGSGIGGVDYGQSGQPRAAETRSAAAPSSQVTVNVTAMDSKSFLDHSSDISNSVRRAMLESSSLNDVIGDM